MKHTENNKAGITKNHKKMTERETRRQKEALVKL